VGLQALLLQVPAASQATQEFHRILTQRVRLVQLVQVVLAHRQAAHLTRFLQASLVKSSQQAQALLQYLLEPLLPLDSQL